MKTKQTILTLLVIVLAVFELFMIGKNVKADQITNYTDLATITKENGTSLEDDGSVSYWEPLTISNQITFPDSQDVKKGDTLVIELPTELKFTTRMEFDVMHKSGNLAGKAVADPKTNKVTVTFTDIFEKLPLDKEMSVKFGMQVNHEKVKTKTPFDVNYEGKHYTVTVDEKTVDPVSPIISKTGYQDPNDYSIMHWKVLVNSNQNAIEDLTVADTLGQGQKLLTDTMLAVQVAYVENDPLDSFDEAASRPYASILTGAVTYGENDSQDAISFKVTAGGASNNTIFMTYDTKLTTSQSAGADLTNNVAVSGNNIGYTTQTGYARVEYAYGDANSRKLRKPSSTTTTTPETPSKEESLTTTTTTPETTSKEESPTTTTTTSETPSKEESPTTTTTTSETPSKEESPTTTTTTPETQSETTPEETHPTSEESTSFAVTSTNNDVSQTKTVVTSKTFGNLPETGEKADMKLVFLGIISILICGGMFYKSRQS